MSERADQAASLVVRPWRIRLVCWIAAPLVVGVFVGVAMALGGPTGAGKGVFRTGDQAAMAGLGVLGALAILAFTRPKVEADERGVRVRNVVGGYELPWNVIRAVRFEPGAPWASLELQDDDEVAVMALQSVDKERAVAGVRALRGLLAEHTPPIME